MAGQNNEFDILTINGYPFNTKDTTARNDIASIIGAIQVNNASISGRINDLNERAFEDLIKISSNDETEISDIDDGMYKIQYVTVETIEEEEVETINNTALLIQKGTNQYLFKDGQILSRTKTNDTWNEWFTDNTTYEFAQSGNTLQMGTNGGTKSNIYTPTIPTSLPANGGNANTVNSHTVESDVPANAVFTDTTYSEATTSKAGLMSANDKGKLNGIAEGATAVSEQTVSNWGFTKNTGTVTGIKMNNMNKTPTNGVVDLGTVITSHQDISGKVNTSTKVNGHALTSDITLTKSDIGLGNVGNFKAVSTVANQGLTDAEKTNARTNIGAGTSSFSGDYDDLTNKPTIPTVPTALSSLSDDTTHRLVTDTEKSTWDGKQAALVSGTSIKTVNNESLLGSGNINANKIPSGSVDSTSTSTAFTATIDGVTELADGVAVILTNGVVASASGCTLNVNGLGAKPIYRAQTLDSAVTTHFALAYTCLFVYNTRRVEGGCWDMFYDSDTTYGSYTWGLGYAVCSTAAATAAKTATIASYKLALGGICVIKFGNACPANATLNIRSRGAKPIYLGTSPITADDIKAGDTVTLLYETTTVSTGVYRILYIDRWKTEASGGDVNVIETVKVNGTALTPDSNKAVDVTVPTALSSLSADATHRLVTDTEKSTWNGKQAALVSGTSIKTVNNESLLGSGNISISGGDTNVIETVKVNGTALTPDANKAVDIKGIITRTDVTGTNVTQALTPNVLYSFGTMTSLTVTLGSVVSGANNLYSFEFSSGIVATTLTLPNTIIWQEDTVTINPNTHYEISIKYSPKDEMYYGMISSWYTGLPGNSLQIDNITYNNGVPSAGNSGKVLVVGNDYDYSDLSDFKLYDQDGLEVQYYSINSAGSSSLDLQINSSQRIVINMSTLNYNIVTGGGSND